MLVLSRKINETIIIGGNIRVTMTAIRSQQVRGSPSMPRWTCRSSGRNCSSRRRSVRPIVARRPELPDPAPRDQIRRPRGVGPCR